VTSGQGAPGVGNATARTTYTVVGGGHAGASAVRVLGESGQPGRIVLISAEGRLPYDRTTLSKPALLGSSYASPPDLWQADEPWTASIEVHLGVAVASIDVDSKKLITSTGETLGFDKLLLATGAEPRRLTLDGADGDDVHYLRDAQDAAEIRRSLAQPSRLVIIGGGVIGLEVAAAARGLGHDVAVIEAGPRVLGRSVPAEVASQLAVIHARNGVRIRTGVLPQQVLRDNGRVTGVLLADGDVVPADVVVIGVGITPRDDLAASAGLAIDDGILVDRSGHTSHPDLYAAGDAVRMRTHPGERGVRVESWQVAGRQGEIAARSMLGVDALYADQPWTWSDQYDVMLQSVGFAPPDAESIVWTSSETDTVLVLGVAGERIVSACGVASGAAIANPIRAVQLILESAARVDLEAIRASAGNLKGLTRLLTASARSTQ
jgi:3-phenylpropionate/trans-cinnamate dioxygenase ferredoxin reductase subunit